MKKINNYRIVSGKTEWVIGRVINLLSEGWELYGNPYNNGEINSSCQGMVKYEEEINDESKKQLNG